ncbi:MAG: S9 family peptidase [Bacteroidetes bacterium]|nr:S9 family peptidase [Bacteroidota bacterium]
MKKQMLQPPKAAQLPHEMVAHGHVRQDEYYWLRERGNEEVIQYLEAENAYTEGVLTPVKQFREQLFEELKGRVKEKDASVPYLSNGYYYYTRFEEGSEYPLYCRKKGSTDAEEEILLEVNELAAGKEYFKIGAREISDDNRFLAYGEDIVGRRIYMIRIKDLKTGELLEDSIPNTNGHAAWSSDNKTIFYTLKDEATLRTYKIMKHVIGQPNEQDEEVFTESDETFFSAVYRSRSKQFLMVYSLSTMTSEYRFLDAGNPSGEFKVVQPRIPNVLYDAMHVDDQFYIRTNADGADNFKLMSVPVSGPAKSNWTEVITHRKDVLLEDATAFRGFLVLKERIRGISELRVLSWNDMKSGYYIDCSEEGHGVWFGPNEEFNTDILRFSYTSMTTPMSQFDFNMKDKSRVLLKETPVLGGFNKEDYSSERIFVTVRDGAEVPVSIVYGKEYKKDGGQPLLLYAYGSYGSSTDPYFSSSRLSLLNRGFAFAIAHIRGGEEMGRHWYEDGKLLKKKNTFNDFIDCGEFLVKAKYAAADKLFAMGGSAGGLLMGAIINLRPDLWKGVVAAVPFVDVVTTMLDETIPLTTFEYDEWGNPNKEEYYHYMLSYSPYDNIASKTYPNLLVTSGLHDSQVQYWEPTKWVARLRDVKQGDELVLLNTNMDAGHGGASGRFKQFREIALNYVFLFYLLGIEE